MRLETGITADHVRHPLGPTGRLTLVIVVVRRKSGAVLSTLLLRPNDNTRADFIAFDALISSILSPQVQI